MGASLGSLVVSLGLDAATFTSGLSRAEYMSAASAKKIADNIDVGMAGAITAFGAVATAAIGAFAAIDQIASHVADYQDMADKIGDTAEAIASLQLAADISGVSLDTVVSASVRLTASMSKTDEETKGAGKAIAALGLNLEDFKKRTPTEQIEDVAKALAGFEDGAGKTAVAVALFGKSGAELMPVLKDLADEGGRNVRITGEMIAAADQYDKEKRRLTSTVKTFVQVLALSALPTLIDLGSTLLKVAGEITNVDTKSATMNSGNAVADWADKAVRALAVVMDGGEGVVRIFQAVGKTIGAAGAQMVAMGKLDLKGMQNIGQDWLADMDKLANAPLLGGRIVAGMEAARSSRVSLAGGGGGWNDRRDAGKPVLDFDATTGGKDKKGPKAKDLDAEAKAYLENLQRAQNKLEDLTAVQTLYSDIEAGRLKVTNEGLMAQIESAALLNDLSKDEAERIKENAKLDKLRLEQQKKLEKEVAEAREDGIGPIERTAEAVKRYQELIGTLGFTAEEAAAATDRAWSKVLGKVEEKTEAQSEFVKQAARNMQDLLGDAIGDVFLGKFEGGMKGMLAKWTETLAKMAAQAAAAELMNSLLGSGKTGGASGGGWLSSLFGAVTSYYTGGATGAKAEGGGVMAGSTYIVGERGPEKLTMGSSGHVTPNGGGASAGPASFHIETNVKVDSKGSSTERSGGQDTTGRTLATMVEQLVQSKIQKEMMQGGVLWKQRMGYA